MRLFGPSAKVTVVPQSTLGVAAAPGVEITRLRIQFDVKKDSGKQPNKCTIKINGLSPTTRALIKKPAQVILHAGYDGVLKLLFAGDLSRVFTSLDGKCDYVTEIGVHDGLRAFSTSRVDRMYKAPVTVKRILKDCAASFVMALPPEALNAPELDQTLPDDLSWSSETHQLLTRVLAPLGWSWSHQNNQLVILKDGQVRGGEEVLVNRGTGLVGSPKFKESEHQGKGTKTEVTFETLLYPEIVPGVGVRLESRALTQSLKVTDSTSKGDTKPGGEWLTEVKAKPL